VYVALLDTKAIYNAKHNPPEKSKYSIENNVVPFSWGLSMQNIMYFMVLEI